MSISPYLLEALSLLIKHNPDIGLIVYNKKKITNRITLIKYIRKYMYYNLALRAHHDNEPDIVKVP